MTSRKMSFLEFWRSKKEREELLQRANQLRLAPSQLRRLLGDSEVRAALQNNRMASLLPPVGEEVFRRFTPASLEQIQKRQETKSQARDTEVKESDRPKPARDLQAGKPLPFIYGAPPRELLNTPLEELDSFYQSQKTFIVLGKGNVLSRFRAEPSCYLLSPFNPLRTVAIKVLLHSLFNLFILLTILTNCVFMTMSSPPEWSHIMEFVFTAIYTFEVVVKVLSRGFCIGSFTFLRDPWNWLDLVVIITAYLSHSVYLWDHYVLTTIPRVLKLIAISPGLKTTVGALVQSLKGLVDVIFLMVFGLSLFALMSLQIFMGTMKNKCVKWMTESPEFNYSESENNASYAIYDPPGQLDFLQCGNDSAAGYCPEGYTCVKTGPNPNYGYMNYDSFGPTLLTVVQLVTKDFSDYLMMRTLRTSGQSYFTYFVVVILPGCFCLLSLVVGVVARMIADREEVSATEAKEREEVFQKIEEVVKRREEEEEAACRAAPSDGPDAATEGSDEDRRSCSPCWSVLANFLLKWNCCGCWRWLKQKLYTFITNPFFDLGIIICLIANTIFMAMEHYPLTERFEWTLSVAELVFTAIFTAELLVKVVAMDPYKYFQVSWNIFDSIIVLGSLLELTIANRPSIILLRVFRLARWWPSFHMLLKITWSSVKALRNLTVLLLIMVFLFSVVGLQLFRMDYQDNNCLISTSCELPRWHMHDFFHAFLIMIRALFGNWTETLYDCMEVSGQASCLIFYMTFLIIGNFLVLNLFLTLLLSSFGSGSLVALEEKEKKQISRAVGKTHINPDHTVDSKGDNIKDYLALTVVASDQQVSEVKALGSDQHTVDSQLIYIADAAKTPEDEEKRHPEVQQHLDDGDPKGDGPEDCCSDKCYSCCPFLNIDKSQGIGRGWSNFRRACFSIVQHKCFEILIIVIILLSSVALMFEDIHLQHRPVLRMVLGRADVVFTYLFLMEMILKWIALGFKKYFTDAWCWLDFIILNVFLVSLAADAFGFYEPGSIQFLRTLRALAPLRALSRFKGLRVVVQTVVRTVPSMCRVLLVFLTVWLIFGVLGVHQFGGKFFYCFNETSQEYFLHEFVNNKTECMALMWSNFSEVTWKNIWMNYDNTMNSYLSLLHLGASAECLDLLYAASDADMVESQPRYENNIYTYFYWIFFIIFGCFFTSIFLIRVIIDHLQRDKSAGKRLFMSEKQQEFRRGIRRSLMISKKPIPRPQNCCQARLFDLVTKPYFEVFMLVMICLNMVILMMETDNQSYEKDEILYWFHFSFILIFLIEFLLKIIALRRHYFNSSLNVLDFVVLITSILGLFITDLIEKYFIAPTLFSMFRLARVTRLFSLIRCARGVRKLLLAFLMSLPALLNISLLLSIIWITFSIFGMFNFAYVKKEAGIDDMFNFETFGSSMICLFMINPSSDWIGLLIPLLKTPPDCDSQMEHPGFTVTGDCGTPVVAIIFFITHITLTFLLGIHLYIAVVLETFNSDESELLNDDDLQMFYVTWRKFDPKASQFIQYSELSDLCDALRDPLRIPKPNTVRLINMDLPLHPGDKIHCVDILHALATQVLGDSGKMDSLKARIEEKFMTTPPKVSGEPISSTLQRKQEDVAAAVIQRAYRKHVLQHGDAKESANGGGVV
ncbi:sodium channel protein type 4 subunit alpha B-like isoform X2 [Centropristis striata]|uniref:sodium channel protein type 4 subunit alpha B-like isoform X2 n=1 Tax=Centropristis striata TaxID=184440 RepID=UPI0027E160CB|nr:sodium channel protein type 4 subunit alpha B-like isoform X2 [Centropristis striata]